MNGRGRGGRDGCGGQNDGHGGSRNVGAVRADHNEGGQGTEMAGENNVAGGDRGAQHHLGARNSGNSLGKILVFSAIFLENFYNFSVANNNVCNLDINNYYSISTITKPIPIFTIFIFTVTLPNVLYLKSHTSKILVSAITTLGH
jgi:hypothetical protein